jgi:hypothetical protein
MQTQTLIDFEGIPGFPIRAVVDRHLADLESRYGRVTACRIVRGPGERHQTSGQHQVSISLALPGGREVNVARTPSADERCADLTFAVDDAFKRARRQLQDRARIMRGEVKLRSQVRGP